jgi:hypothetical protein
MSVFVYAIKGTFTARFASLTKPLGFVGFLHGKTIVFPTSFPFKPLARAK